MTEGDLPRKLTHGTMLPPKQAEPKQEVKRVPNRTMRRNSGWRKTAKQGYRKRHAAQQNKGTTPWGLRGDATGDAEGSADD